jgi:hypothetical protein
MEYTATRRVNRRGAVLSLFVQIPANLSDLLMRVREGTLRDHASVGFRITIGIAR